MSDIDKALELARAVVAWREWLALTPNERRALPESAVPDAPWGERLNVDHPDLPLARALLRLAAEHEAMAKVVEAAERMAEASGYAFVGPGQYEAAGASVQLREAVDAYRALAEQRHG